MINNKEFMQKKEDVICDNKIKNIKKVKVLQAVKWYSPVFGGIERVILDIKNGINEDIDMKILACSSNGDFGVSVDSQGVEVHKVKTIKTIFSMPISFKYLTKFRKLTKDVDVIQFHAPFPLSDLALFLCRRKKAKKVLWWHSDVVRQKKAMFFYKPLMKWFLKRMDKILVASPLIAEQSKYLKAHMDKVEVLRFGIDISKYNGFEFKPVLQEKLKDKANKKLLFVGRLVYYKGVDVLFDAFRGVMGAELFIIGDGELRGQLENYAAENLSEAAGKIHFLGNVDDEYLKSAFADCDLFILPSVDRAECFGIVQLEAMVNGKPVINTALPTAVPEVSLDGISGITVNPLDSEQLCQAIQKLVDDDSLRKEYGKNAYERVVKEFNLEHMQSRVMSIYQSLASQKSNKYSLKPRGSNCDE